MNTSHINTVLTQHPHTRKYFLGTFPSDKCPQKPQAQTCFVSNTDPQSEPGQHWIAFYIKSDGNIFYFDPYGIPPISIYHQRFLNKSSDGRGAYNKQQLQNFYSHTCGAHCINFLIVSCRTQDPHQTLRDLLNLPTNFTDRIVKPLLSLY